MIFQDPMASLNPRMRVGDIVEEPLIIHRERDHRRDRVVAMLERVGLSSVHLNRYPHSWRWRTATLRGMRRALATSAWRLLLRMKQCRAAGCVGAAQALAAAGATFVPRAGFDVFVRHAQSRRGEGNLRSCCGNVQRADCGAGIDRAGFASAATCVYEGAYLGGAEFGSGSEALAAECGRCAAGRDGKSVRGIGILHGQVCSAATKTSSPRLPHRPGDSGCLKAISMLGVARNIQEAHVDSVTVFAKCHHGLLYYDTKRPERHPNLKKGLDLLGEQVEALHREGIRAPIYISVLCDEYAADTHPEWVWPAASTARWFNAYAAGRGSFYQWQIIDDGVAVPGFSRRADGGDSEKVQTR